MSHAEKDVILVADDDAVTREVVASALESVAGVAVLTASDGKEALRRARSLRPALLLLDMALPKLDGLEVARRLKSSPETRGIAIIIVSGLSAAPERALALGCEDYIQKPFEVSDLLAKVKRHLRRGAERAR